MQNIPKAIHIFSVIPKLSEMVSAKLPEVTVKNVIEADISKKYEKKINEKELSEVKDAEVIIGDSHFISQVYTQLPHVKWVQCTWAGIEKLAEVIKAGSKPSFPITRLGTQSFSQLMAEYAVGWIINYERGWLDARQYQFQSIWNHDGKIAIYRSLQEITVAVLGVGAIGSEVISALKCFQCKVYGFGRSAEAPKSIQLDKYFSSSSNSADLKALLLSGVDYIVNVLPSTPETKGLLASETLKCAKNKPVFINIGRSNVISEEDVIKALENSWISAAILDVFDEEPLPKSSPLWLHPKVIVTPHVAGVSRPKDVVNAFMENWELYLKGEPLKNLVDWDKGY